MRHVWLLSLRIVLALVVRTMDNSIHRINRYPVDSAVCFANTYSLDSAADSVYPPFEQLEPGGWGRRGGRLGAVSADELN